MNFATEHEIDRELRDYPDICLGRPIIARNRVIARKTIQQRLKRNYR